MTNQIEIWLLASHIANKAKFLCPAWALRIQTCSISYELIKLAGNKPWWKVAWRAPSQWGIEGIISNIAVEIQLLPSTMVDGDQQMECLAVGDNVTLTCGFPHFEEIIFLKDSIPITPESRRVTSIRIHQVQNASFFPIRRGGARPHPLLIDSRSKQLLLCLLSLILVYQSQLKTLLIKVNLGSAILSSFQMSSYLSTFITWKHKVCIYIQVTGFIKALYIHKLSQNH